MGIKDGWEEMIDKSHRAQSSSALYRAWGPKNQVKPVLWNSQAQNESAHTVMVREVKVVTGPARISFGESLAEKVIVPLVPDFMF